MNDYANITQITLLVRRLDIGTKVIGLDSILKKINCSNIENIYLIHRKKRLSWQGLIWMDNLCFMVLFFQTSV